ncbi:hypothetical protein JZ751_000384 [Albula glossodonta]|uniref:C2H2-type domain-containing protein n=1 Tax=Albula glossodonta TaxID=121402 RepID=A0A8T2PWF2_9TELE|nr:hypothetical protein JZ751_000384 [Albula glossodonta]
MSESSELEIDLFCTLASTFPKAIKELTQTDKLKEVFRGLNFVVEYRCLSSDKLCGYLCMLCRKRVRETQVIAHVIGFDHIFWYLDLVHPSSLCVKSSYRFYSVKYSIMILDLATQAQKIGSSGEVQEMTLDPEVFTAVETGSYAAVAVPRLVLYEYIVDQQRKDPVIGLNHVTCCIDAGDVKAPIYLCHTCQDKCTSHVIVAHLTSYDHYFCTLMLYLPEKIYKKIGATPYLPTLKALCQTKEMTERLRLNKYTKLHAYLGDSTRKHPLLGLKFLVEYKSKEPSNLCGYLCLLCKKRIRETLVIAHIIGFEHVFCYLDLTHPSSLGSKNLYKHYDAQYSTLILDLASQAEKIDSHEKVKVIKLDLAIYEEVDSAEFSKALNLLQTIWREEMQSDLQPVVIPGQRLYPKNLKPGMCLESKNLCQSSEHAKPGQSSEHAKPGQSSEHAKPGQSSEHAKPGQSSELLWDFLKNKARKEPVIDTALCLPSGCKMALLELGSDSQKAEAEKKSQHLLCGWGELPDLSKRIEVLKARAAAVEQESGFGKAKVLELDTTQYKEIFSSSSDVALKKLQTIQNPQMLEELRQCDFQPPVISEDKPVTVKQENVQVSDEGSSQEVKKASESTVIGEASETRMSKVLGRYLNSELRKEPVIGLNSIIEYQGDNQTNCLECKVCCRRLPVNCIIGHLLGPRHRYMYIKSKYPKLLDGWKDNPDLTGNIHKLRTMAKKLEEEEGLGQFKVTEVGNPSVREMGLPSVHKGLKEVTECRTKGQKPFYLCNICRAKIPMNHVLGHVTGAHHRYNYIKAQYPSLLKRNVKKNKLHTISNDLLQLAVIIKEKESAIEDVQIMELSEEQHMKLFAMSVENALKNLQTMQKEQNQKKEDRKVTVKQEVEDQSCSETCTEESIQDAQHIDTEQAPVREKAACSPVILEQPVTEWKSTEIRQAAIEQDMGKVQAVLQESESTKEITASMYAEKVCYQMTSRVSLQRTQIDAAKRGLQAVVECRSLKQPTFYLCLTCAKKINKNCICNHIISDQHQYYYIDSQYPDLIPDWQKNPIDVAMRVEAYEKIWDVQAHSSLLQSTSTLAGLSIPALNLLQKIQREHRHHQPLMTRGHRPIYFSEKRFQSPGAPQEPYQELVERQRVSHGEHGVGNGAAQQEPRTQFEKPHQSKVCVGEKRIQSLGAPQEAYQDLKVVERQRVEAELAKVSPWEPWPIKKGTETDRGVVERVNRPPVDLRAYVADPQRNEPVVGLSALIECCSEKQPPLHLCVACSTHLNKTPAIFHIISNKHRLSYLWQRRPDLFMDWNNSQDPAKMSSCLITMAREVEREENGSLGDIQVVSLDSRTYTEVKSMPFDKALNLLQPIYKEQRQSDLQLRVTPEHRLATLKQEKMESEEYPEEPIPDPLNTEAEYVRSCLLQKDQKQQVLAHTYRAGEDKPIRQEYQLGLGIKTPVIGLHLVIECRSLEGWPPPFYLCQACSVKLTDEQSMNKHLTTVQHLYFYIKSCHSSHLEKEEKAGRSECGMTDLIQSVAKKIEEEDGSGCFQIMNMSEGVYESLKQGDYGYCIKMLKGCNSVEERQTYSKQTDGKITQETAPRGPGFKTLPISHLPAKIRTQEIAYQCQQPDLLVPLRDVTIHNPSTTTGCPVPENGTSQPFAPHQTDQGGEPWPRTSGHLSLSPAGPTHSLCDTLSHHTPAAPELAKAKAASGHHPSQAAGSSRAACSRRSVTIDCGLQGERIATVGRLHSSATVQRLSTADAGKRKHLSEGQEGEGPWNYENRQFTSAPQKRSASQAKQNCRVPIKRESTSDFHQLNKGPHPAEIRRASVGHPSNIFIDPSSVAPKSSSCGGLEEGARKPAPLQSAVRDAVRNSGNQSRSKYLTKDRSSEGGTNRIVISPASSTNVAQSARHATVVRSMTKAGVPQTVSVVGSKLPQSSSLPHKRMDDTAIDAIIRSLSNSDCPPAKIPGMDHDDSQLSPAERLLTNWKAITGIEVRPISIIHHPSFLKTIFLCDFNLHPHCPPLHMYPESVTTLFACSLS